MVEDTQHKTGLDCVQMWHMKTKPSFGTNKIHVAELAAQILSNFGSKSELKSQKNRTSQKFAKFLKFGNTNFSQGHETKLRHHSHDI
jgi:DNA repair protein RadC